MKEYRENPTGELNQLATKQNEREKFAVDMMGKCDLHGDENDSEMCEQCGGDGEIMLSEAGPSVWGEDCFCDEDRPIKCPSCNGFGA